MDIYQETCRKENMCLKLGRQVISSFINDFNT